MSNALKNKSHLNDEIEALRNRLKYLDDLDAKHRMAKQTLIESEKKYRTIFENTGAATILIEEDTTISMANFEFEKITGFSRKDIEGKKSWIDFIHKDDIDMMKEYHYKRRIDKNLAPRNYECRIINKSGEIRICFATVALIQGTMQSLASFMDITEKRKAEEALRNSREKFAKVFRSSPGILITTLNEGRFVDVNPTFLNLTGYCREEIIGFTIKNLHIWPDMKLYDNMVNNLLEDRNLNNYEIEFCTKSNEIRTGLMSAEIIDLQSEMCILQALVDISEQKRLEMELLKISERERLSIGRNLQDDLGQHLIGIEALSTLLEHRLEQEFNPETSLSKEISELIRGAIIKTRNLAKGLCPVNMDEGGLVVALNEFAIRIEKVFDVFCQLDFDRNIRIEDNTIATNLYHIVQESTNNAIRHGRADYIIINLSTNKNSIVLSITDNGCGIKKSDLKKSDNKKGLGLNIMEYRAKRIGARLEITGKKDKGTKIVCTLKKRTLY